MIEHENEITTSYEEMNKLCIFNTPLKVLITYPYRNGTEKYLREYVDIVQRADIFGDFSTKQKHLVIFGKKEYNEVKWDFYIYINGSFVKLRD